MLVTFSRYAVPQALLVDIVDTMARYGRLQLVKDPAHGLTLVSLDRAVLDAGRKAITAENHTPLVQGYPDARVVMHSAEHIVLELGTESQNLQIGDQVELIVGYADFTTPLHNEFLCFRGDRLESIWPIAARGMLQ